MLRYEPPERRELAPSEGSPTPSRVGLAAAQPGALIIVGGVPGAGKSTAIARATTGLGGVRVVDPEQVSGWLRQRLPASVPYRRYRWLVHTAHAVRTVAQLLAGPSSSGRLVLHDPGTRFGRRRTLIALARRAGWRVTELYIDVDRTSAQEGQRRRGRVVRSFDEHWQNWQRLRPSLAGGSRGTDDGSVLLVDRANAAEVLRQLCQPTNVGCVGIGYCAALVT